MADAPRRIVLILGHPRLDSYCGALADTYAKAATAAGHELLRYNLCDLDFDPLMDGRYYQGTKSLEPHLAEVQQAILWADHLVFVYPTWWGVMPALLKGFFDRTFLPGFAFKYRSRSALWDKLLVGRSARAIVTMDSPPWYFRLITRQPGHHQMRNSILGFCGVGPIRITSVGPIRISKPAQRERWLQRVSILGTGGG